MPEIDFISSVHKKTKRNYLERVTEYPKAKAANIAKKFDFDYWDGTGKLAMAVFIMMDAGNLSRVRYGIIIISKAAIRSLMSVVGRAFYSTT